MHHDISLLINITVVLVTAFAGGMLARRLGLPTIFGYLVAGMAIGPFSPAFIGDIDDIAQLAELGVIFLMFGVGLHFSLKDLWAVRTVAVPGAILQMTIATGLGFLLTRFWGWSVASGLVLGIAISIASTVVLLRGLVDNGLLNTSAGQVAVGWLVLEDLATVLILVLMPAIFAPGADNAWLYAGEAILKAAVFVGLMLFLGSRLLPWILTWIARTRSRELFILAAVAIAMGTAIGSAALFGVSLALGAFLAGVVLSESEVSQQVGAEVLPFRETFAVVFFVSVGMLVNPVYLLEHGGQVLILTALIVFGKAIFTQMLAFILPASGHTMLVVSAGLSQIGEFSFIVGQAGMGLGVLSQEQYSLLLAGALLSIMVNPLMFRAIGPAETFLRRWPWLWARLDRHPPLSEDLVRPQADHVVIVGYGRVGAHIVTVLQRLQIPLLVVEIDARRAVAFQERGVPTIFGDASNSEVLTHAGLTGARALVVTLPSETAAELVVAAARELAPKLPIVARATTSSGVGRLADLGAQDVIHPEFEGGLEVVRHALLSLGYPATQVQRYTDTVRRDQYNTSVSTPEEHQVLEQLLHTARGMQIVWYTIRAHSPLLGQNLSQVNLRACTGASVIALIREQHMLANPKSSTVFQVGDMVGLIGEGEQIAAAEQLITGVSRSASG
ncbi:MAG: sodium:proton exchanger [Candidatus Viridilinea halotolerans]|uniref:Sodium:proton exchanger n=1 Tax=Candidatus Viridilinea halotolerans TaxID=2491704 RepID=A0A426TZV8_9CHLR|nr:MAG: sodium:proton exchanger [Candidatus Viridilinea halotolerans]